MQIVSNWNSGKKKTENSLFTMMVVFALSLMLSNKFGITRIAAQKYTPACDNFIWVMGTCIFNVSPTAEQLSG